MPLDDRQAAELISQSLDQPLSADDSERLNAYLAENPHGRKYAQMLRLLQKLSADMVQAAEDGDAVSDQKLSAEVRDRIEQMLKEASLSAEIGTVAEKQAAGAGAAQRQRDLAFASVLLESQRLSADQLAAASGGWVHSGSSLSDFLVDRGVLSSDARDLLESRVDAALQDTASAQTDETANPDKQPAPQTGSSARLSRLLGLQSDAPTFLDVNCRFCLLRRIGEGGIGSIWLARDERLNRNVAVKRLHTDSEQSAQAVARFRREAEITGRLEHLNIIPVYLSGTDNSTDKDLYVMRFVGKRTLTDAIRDYHDNDESREKDSARLHNLLGMFLRVCDAIAYAHSRGVIHRDLKPDNVALDSFGQVIVLDWGMAKVMGSAEIGPQPTETELFADTDLLQTKDGAVIGTPLYMSPEQAAGDIDPV